MRKFSLDRRFKLMAAMTASFTIRSSPIIYFLKVTSMAVPTVTLNNGRECPGIGLGTWLSPPGECARVTKYAIDIGYRHIDAAWLYGNEKEVGEGVKKAIDEGTVKRDDMFITTKLWNTFHEKDDVVPALKSSLENLGMDYIDLYLIHWPVACKNTGYFDIKLPFKEAVYYEHDFCETWKGMEECVDLGLTKSIGLSNFNSKQVQRILDNAKVKPVMNQIEVSSLINQTKLIKFCMERGIHITAYSPFGSPARPWQKPGEPSISFDDLIMVKIGEKYGKTTSQVILRYLVQLGVIPVPKSSNLERLKQNMDIFDFELSSEEMKVMEGYNHDFRAVHADDLKKSNEYPFKEGEF